MKYLNIERKMENNLDTKIIDVPPAPQPVGEIIYKTPKKVFKSKYYNEVSMAFEAEFDIYQEEEIDWGVWYEYFIHKDFMYCYKPMLENILKSDLENIENDKNNQGLKQKFIDFINLAKETLSESYSLEKIPGVPFKSLEELKKSVIGKIEGIPNLVSETPQFFQFEKPKGELITPQNLTKETLLSIKKTFKGNINPFFTEMSECLFDNNGKICCVDLLAFSENEYFKYGIILNTITDDDSFSTKYNYFFPFEKIELEKENSIKKIISYISNSDGNEKETIVVYL